MSGINKAARSFSNPPTASCIDIDSLMDIGSQGTIANNQVGQNYTIQSNMSIPTATDFFSLRNENKPLRKTRSKSDNMKDLIDIDAVLSVGDDLHKQKFVGEFADSVYTSEPSKFFYHTWDSKRASAVSRRIERSPHVIKIKKKSVNGKSSKLQGKPFVVDLDKQDIDTLIQVSRFHSSGPSMASNTKNESEDSERRNSNISQTKSVDSDKQDSSEIPSRTSVSIDSTANSTNSETPMIHAGRENFGNGLMKELIYTGSDTRVFAFLSSNNQTDIDELVSFPETLKGLVIQDKKQTTRYNS